MWNAREPTNETPRAQTQQHLGPFAPKSVNVSTKPLPSALDDGMQDKLDLLEKVDAVLVMEHEAELRRMWRDDDFGEVVVALTVQVMMPELA
ncbi:hypothetical protein PR003_g1444 [Phytophthora rubi]|uniref:Uncharacterized protein n=1 Tax=Phytophthora rubi TaxID=129364 RepID=A0A6A4G5I8_9STRA|nr:hypothetical protein PR001_g710 [Phytophthora rubi]KAE9358123.1 hypothetical protein PR003_g1444 [Phytophthora rubi]